MQGQSMPDEGFPLAEHSLGAGLNLNPFQLVFNEEGCG
jgi:hypothetical protein